MKDRLKDYVLVIPNVITQSLCKKILKEIETVKWKPHTFYYHETREEKNVSPGHESEYSFSEIKSQEILKKKVWKAIHTYILEYLNFKWFPGWDGFSPIKFNRYNKNKLMKEHADTIKSIFDGERRGIPILSIIGALNHNYEGGELVLFQDTEYRLKAGEVLIFPSNFMYPHQVMPVTKGTRFTYTSWVY